jgi:hypothetical protein
MPDSTFLSLSTPFIFKSRLQIKAIRDKQAMLEKEAAREAAREKARTERRRAAAKEIRPALQVVFRAFTYSFFG